MSSIVKIFTVRNQNIASFIKDKFAEKAVQCFLSYEGIHEDDKQDHLAVEIYVENRHIEKAVRILLDLHAEYDLNKTKSFDPEKELKLIIVPADMSDDALNAGLYAVSLAKKINAEIKFVFIFRDPAKEGISKAHTSWERHAKLAAEQMLKDAEKKLTEFSNTLNARLSEEEIKQVQIHYSLYKGEPSQIINAVNDQFNPFLTVIGTGWKYDKQGVFISDEATEIIENSHYPVLTVPKSVLSPGDQLNIMYATNFNESDNTSLNTLLKITEPFDKKIRCIHIDFETDPLKHEKINELNDMLKENYSEHQIQCDLFVMKDLLKGFEEYIKKNNINLVSFSSPKRNIVYKIFRTNKLKKMVSASKVPMLIFRV